MDILNTLLGSFGFVAGVLAIIAFVPYIAEVISGKTKPVLATWVVFATVDILALWGLLTTQNPTSLYVPVGFAVGASATLIIAFFRSRDKSFSLLDIICMVIASFGVAGMFLSGEGMIGVYASLIAMGVGAIPTLIHAIKKPKEESFWAWLLFGISAIFNALYPGNWESFDKFIFPAVIAALNVPIMSVMIHAKYTKRI